MGALSCKPQKYSNQNTLTSIHDEPEEGGFSYGAPKAKKPKKDKAPKPVKAKKQKKQKHGPVPVPADPILPNAATVRALVTYCDYGFEPAKSQGWVPPGFPGGTLDTKENADMIVELLQAAGVTDITTRNNLNCTAQDMLGAIHEVGAKCTSDDLFFFFYSGHGATKPDEDGDEDDGIDEAMCLPDKSGQCNENTWLVDDEFSEAVASIVCEQKLFIIDCCHSGTLLDFDKPHWEGQAAVSIVGCKDSQEGAAMGGGTRGGAFSKAITAAVKSWGSQEVDVGTIYNTCLEKAPQFIPPGHEQDIQIDCAPGTEPHHMVWPLPYKR